MTIMTALNSVDVTSSFPMYASFSLFQVFLSTVFFFFFFGPISVCCIHFSTFPSDLRALGNPVSDAQGYRIHHSRVAMVQ